MVGVTSPLMLTVPSRGRRLMAGFVAGHLCGAIILTAVLYLVGSIIVALANASVRLAAFGAIMVALGLADVAGRTPSLRRQTPQSLVRALPPFSLGLAWGFDIGLSVTTIRVTSILWGVLAYGVLLHPKALPILMAVYIGVGLMSYLVRSHLPLRDSYLHSVALGARARSIAMLGSLVIITAVTITAGLGT